MGLFFFIPVFILSVGFGQSWGFYDLAQNQNLDFKHDHGGSGKYFYIESMGGGVCLLDFDNDGDLELFAGSTVGLEVFDIKSVGSNEGFWNTHRGNQSRTGYIEISNSSCTTADVNSDGIIDILDIVQTINIAMGFASPTDTQLCAADVNGDGIVDILDIVMMVNIVISG